MKKIIYKDFQLNQKEKNIYIFGKIELQDSIGLHLLLKHYNIEHIKGSLNFKNITSFYFFFYSKLIGNFNYGKKQRYCKLPNTTN